MITTSLGVVGSDKAAEKRISTGRERMVPYIGWLPKGDFLGLPPLPTSRNRPPQAVRTALCIRPCSPDGPFLLSPWEFEPNYLRCFSSEFLNT